MHLAWHFLGNPSFQFRKIIGNHLQMKHTGFNHSGNVLCYVSGCNIDAERAVGSLPSTSSSGPFVFFSGTHFQGFQLVKSAHAHNHFFDQPGHSDARNADCSVQNPFGYQVHGDWPATYCNQTCEPTAGAVVLCLKAE